MPALSLPRTDRTGRGMYFQPRTLQDALQALAAHPYIVLAGGTDFYPARVGKPIDDDILDISRIDELRGWDQDAHRIRLGATMTWSDALGPGLPSWCEPLRLAAGEVGGLQIQNNGTIAGNLCNASPAADGVPALLALNAQVELASLAGRRLVALRDFIIASRTTTRAADELVTAIHLPQRSARACGTFLKLGARKYLVISIAMVAALIDVDEESRLTHAAIAVGACSAVAQRLPALEARLIGRQVDSNLAALATVSDLAPISPIDDVRATAMYRREIALELVQRAITQIST